MRVGPTSREGERGSMPKGRGANERRRSWRQKHPRENKVKGYGGMKLAALYGRAVEVQKDRRREVERARSG